MFKKTGSTPGASKHFQPFLNGLISIIVIAIQLVSFKNQHNRSFEHERARKNGQLPLAKGTIRSTISSERWEQIKTAYAAGIGLREIARKLDIPEGTVLAHAKHHGWSQQIQIATHQQSDAITPVQSVPQSVGAMLNEQKERSRLGLSRFAAEAAEQAAEHPDKLEIAGKVKDVASVHKTLWPEENQREPILNLAVLTGQIQLEDSPRMMKATKIRIEAQES